MEREYEINLFNGLETYLKELLTAKSYKIGAYTFDVEKRLLTLNNESVKLTRKESYVLVYFAANINKSLARKDLLTTIWKEDNHLNSRNMDVYICRIRKLLSKDPGIMFVNVHGKGYRMVVD